jgi:dipeptidyl aminopeptidase/acylaminoacyl peptidase
MIQRQFKELRMRNRFVTWHVSLLLISLIGDARADQPAGRLSLDQRIDSLVAVRNFKDVSLSPDGKWVAWVEEVPSTDENASPGSALFVASLEGGAWSPRRINAENAGSSNSASSPAWSPDSRQLAFLSDPAETCQSQLFLTDLQTGAVKKLTNLTGQFARPRYSPAGDQIALLVIENIHASAGPTAPAAQESGVIGEEVDEQRLGVVDSHTGQMRLVSPADQHVFEYDWSPDGKQFVAIAAEGDGNNNWYIARLIRLAADSGKVETLLEPRMQIANPRWSPDGRTIAFIGGLMSDEGSNGGDIFVIPATGGPPRNVTPDLKASASWLAWQPASTGIIFTAHVEGASGIFTVETGRGETAKGQVATVWTGDEVIAAEGGAFSLSLSRNQKMSALVRHSFERPPELWSGPIGNWKQRTTYNSGRARCWGDLKSLHWKSDGMTIQGWLQYPQNYDPKQRYPMIVSIHGGPASAKRPGWPGYHFDFTLLSADGYFVFFPNPRGSFGQGEQFTRANVKDFGHGDLRDTMTGVDYVLKTLPVDDKRLGLVGWSYGGFTAMWTVTQTNRYQVAVAGAGIANWQSYYGQNGIDQWLIPYFGATVYDDPEVYARSSPMNFIKQVKTPTLVVVGERDQECPLAQSYEFWRGLRRHQVPTQLVVYSGEGHAIRRTENKRDILRRSVLWLNRVLQPDLAAAVEKSHAKP